MRYPGCTKVSSSFPLIFSRSYLHITSSQLLLYSRNSSPLHHRSIEDRAESAVSIVMAVIVTNRPSVSHRLDEQSSKLRNHRAQHTRRSLSRRSSRCKLHARLIIWQILTCRQRESDVPYRVASIDIHAIRRSSAGQPFAATNRDLTINVLVSMSVRIERRSLSWIPIRSSK